MESFSLFRYLQVAFELVENQHVAFMARVSAAVSAPASASAAATAAVTRLTSILSGEVSARLTLDFLRRNNHTDTALLDSFVARAEPRNLVVHSAIVSANALMNAGSTSDAFFHTHAPWLRAATGWNKFAATGCIGVLNRGNCAKAETVLAAFLPTAASASAAAAAAAAAPRRPAGGDPPAPPAAAFEEAGAYYAMGLMSCGISTANTPFLRAALKKEGADEVQTHGAMLGLGLSAVGTHDRALYSEVHDALLVTESAVVGEAAGYAIGLIFLGSGDATVQEDLLSLAADSPHEKTIRGAAMGLALCSYGREGAADALIARMLRDKDPVVRYGGAWTVALAYAATGDATAIQRLLRAAVTDASDDVRRAAVTALGFVLINAPEQAPRLVALLAESYNPFVRYGAAMAVGVACAGAGLAIPEAHALLETLIADKTDFVRQGAFIAMGMLLQGVTDTPAGKVKLEAFRAAVTVGTNRRGDTAGKLGVYLGAGLVDAGGKNSVVVLRSSTGHKRMVAIAGAALFCQYWYWHPLVNMISLSLSPAAVIGVTQELKVPTAWKLVSAKPPSWFGYPKPAAEAKKEDEKKKVVNVLSIGKKKKKRVEGAALSRTGSLLSRAASAVAAPSNTKPAAASSSAADSSSSASSGASAQSPTPAHVPTVAGGRVAAAPTGTNSSISSSSLAGKPIAMDDDDDAAAPAAAAAATPAAPVEDKVVILSNPTRVVPAQQRFIVVPPTQRFHPVTTKISGVVVLEDQRPGEEYEVFPPTVIATATDGKTLDGSDKDDKKDAGAAEGGADKKEGGDKAAAEAAAVKKMEDKDKEEDESAAKEKAAEDTASDDKNKGSVKDAKDEDDDDEPDVPPSFNMKL